jgi:hypothetical protein
MIYTHGHGLHCTYARPMRLRESWLAIEWSNDILDTDVEWYTYSLPASCSSAKAGKGADGAQLSTPSSSPRPGAREGGSQHELEHNSTEDGRWPCFCQCGPCGGGAQIVYKHRTADRIVDQDTVDCWVKLTRWCYGWAT